MNRSSLRTAIAVLAILTIGGAVAWASTSVTITKSESSFAITQGVDDGVYTLLHVQQTASGAVVSYTIHSYKYDPVLQRYVYLLLERGYGLIDEEDVVYGRDTISVDTNTSDIASVGAGGDLRLTWTLAPGAKTEVCSKQVYRTETMKRTTWGDSVGGSALVSGTIFGVDYAAPGSMSTTEGKVILQLK